MTAGARANRREGEREFVDRVPRLARPRVFLRHFNGHYPAKPPVAAFAAAG
jgi:hypothetical protein